ncbi:MAG: putative DNA-binding protein [Micavibrio sp.]|nr:putative DNA-binding protein [Micavibrio sp.]
MNTAPDMSKADIINDPMPTAPETLLARLDSQGIPYTLHHHNAFFTVAEGLEIERTMEGVHCRNLFLRDKKGAMFLVSAANETLIDLKKLSGLLGCGRLSFGSPERLWTYLGVRPGSVCPYAIINDRGGVVTQILDAYMMKGELVNFHPLLNTMTIGVTPNDLVKFIRSTGREPRIVDLTSAAPDPTEGS